MTNRMVALLSNMVHVNRRAVVSLNLKRTALSLRLIALSPFQPSTEHNINI